MSDIGRDSMTNIETDLTAFQAQFRRLQEVITAKQRQIVAQQEVITAQQGQIAAYEAGTTFSDGELMEQAGKANTILQEAVNTDLNDDGQPG